MGIAADENAEKTEREVAIRYLARSEAPDALVIVARQLLSEEPGVRTIAYYSLPEKARPADFDYTKPPSDASRAVVAKIIERIRQ